MRYRSRSQRPGSRFFLMAAAFGLGVGSMLLHAQEPAPPAKGSAPGVDKADRPTPAARLRAQQWATRKAKAAYEIARASRELAEVAVEEYAWKTYPRDLASVDGEIKLAKSDLARSEERRNWARRMFDKGYVTKAIKASEELSFKKAQFALEQAQSKRKVLVAYTRTKTVKELQGAVEKARTDELARRAAWEREKAKQAELERSLIRPASDLNPT